MMLLDAADREAVQDAVARALDLARQRRLLDRALHHHRQRLARCSGHCRQWSAPRRIASTIALGKSERVIAMKPVWRPASACARSISSSVPMSPELEPDHHRVRAVRLDQRQRFFAVAHRLERIAVADQLVDELRAQRVVGDDQDPRLGFLHGG